MTTEQATIVRNDRDRVAVLLMDYPRRTMNIVDERLLDDLRTHVDRILADASVDAIVLGSAKAAFGAGADVAWLPTLVARPDAEEFLAKVHRLMLELAGSPKPVVAAVAGSALGGALELALATSAIVAAENARLGLPEVTLGLLPGGGGTQLLRRFVRLDAAADLLTTGRSVDARQAADLGLVQQVATGSDLIATAVSVALGRVGALAGVALLPGTASVLDAQRDALADSRAGLTSAAAKILDVLAAGIADGIEEGLAQERRGFLELARSPYSRAAIHMFLVEADAKRRARTAEERVGGVAVVGGGQMGAGIAATAVTRGLSAVVRDVGSEDSLDRARAYLDAVLARSGRNDDEVRDRWTATVDWEGFSDAGAVVEAVFEDLDLKQRVLADVSDHVPDSALVATNTSAISIARLASAVSHPDRFIGMHFFSPVERMPLVELIPHRDTAPETALRAAALGRQLGKVPVVVGDAPGFFTSRVYARWLMEGIRLLLDGLPAEEIDAAAQSAGFPVGPLRAHDEATLELVVQASIGQVAENVMTDRLDVPALREALGKLVAGGVRGRRFGKGFYVYEDGKRKGPNDEVIAILGVPPSEAARDTAAERLLLAFATESFLCWDDGTLCHPDDGDLAAVLGIGFPRSLGGPFHWADEQGAAAIVKRCRALGTSAFPPGVALERLAAEGGRFAHARRRMAPFTDAAEQA
ncbi:MULTISPECIES: 3-hydroxyacyl-CoA dehydrogenase NAD-binding domain-containing protein [Streptomyces]|uniref:3-hydroxyacyl-CoA dehydrogenase NAD-binding domain-containing protein n=1 Tax=Streptomyces TaxID=1883 RepID=UPI0029A21138|nr:3-hydroxyacyl-CoA dehydrogenase NAD-binding domain-containing protein [Streptomyces europaeiscabiei]MDX3715731.1 3-hydroxyacyl-CoA dehydrogenase NAD-binding domain-containing protein [Streptomyces europaeiscabiei]WSG20052.1 3-hydroxyacyl-CoA dehydrogenase NAD-binding domain-containing protein [Streptomyces europaeiscabiei]